MEGTESEYASDSASARHVEQVGSNVYTVLALTF